MWVCGCVFVCVCLCGCGCFWVCVFVCVCWCVFVVLCVCVCVFRIVSGIPGVQPLSQPQESYHKSIKKHSGIRLRAATDVVLETTLPQILTVDSRERSGAISSNPLPINSANVASAKILFEGNGDFLMVDTTLYCNRPRAAGDERPVTPVTEERCDMHEQGTMGTISQRLQYKTLKSRYFSLYVCKMVDSQPMWSCIDFWMVTEC